MAEGSLWPLVVYTAAVVFLIAAVLGLSHLLGERHAETATGDSFESGIVPVHRARLRMQSKFYIVAMLFVIFDLEAVYIVSWAIVAREGGWIAFVEVAIFIAVLLAALAYLWRLGALDWGTRIHARAVAARQPTVTRTEASGAAARQPGAPRGAD